MAENESSQPFDAMFAQLVMSLQAAAWQQMGKVASPFSGEVERDLAMAKNTIDLLGMLQAKTKGNLGPEEKKMLDGALYELRLNYVDECNKDEKSGPDSDKTAEPEGDTQPEPDESEESAPDQSEANDTQADRN